MRLDADAQSLFREVLDHPEDDVPRLIYADWCDDHGDTARAEFIRVQIRLARSALPDPHDRPREHELLRLHGGRWRRDLSPWLRNSVVFYRGFINEFNGAVTTLFRGDPEDIAAVASLTVLRLRGLLPSRHTTLFGAWARHVREVQVTDHLSPANVVSVVLRSVPDLKVVRVTRCLLRGWAMEGVIALAHDLRLDVLDLRDNPFDDEAIGELAASHRSIRVGRLELSSRDTTARQRDQLRLWLGHRVHFLD